MKRIILAVLVIFYSFIVNSQTITHPRIAAQSVPQPYVLLNQVEINDENTILSFTVRQQGAGYFIIPKETYIISSDGGEKLFLQEAKGVVINERFSVSGTKSFKLYFPKIGIDVDKINYRGGEDPNSWDLFEINLRPYMGERRKFLVSEKRIISKDGKEWLSITNPRYVAKSSNSFNITRIDVMDTTTVLYFEVTIRSWSVPAESCIQPSDGGKVLFVKSAEGTIINEHSTTESGVARYKLFFPPIDKNVKKINFKELNSTGDWFVFELDVSND